MQKHCKLKRVKTIAYLIIFPLSSFSDHPFARETQTDMYYSTNSKQQLLGNKATIHQVTTMLATSKNVLFPDHTYLLTTSAEDPSLAGARVIINVSGHHYLLLADGYDLEIGYF